VNRWLPRGATVLGPTTILWVVLVEALEN